MLAHANDVVDVYRDTDETDSDEWGDPVETGADPHIAGLAVALTEYGVSVRNGSPMTGDTSQDNRETRYARLRAPKGTDLKRGDVVKSRTTGTRWNIGEIVPLDGGLMPDVRAELVTP
jgi:hypothetical protein